MLVDGLKLMVVGMGMVSIFLVLMVLVMGLSSRILAPWASILEEKNAKPAPRRKAPAAKPAAAATDDASIVSAITAAVHKYRSDRGEG